MGRLWCVRVLGAGLLALAVAWSGVVSPLPTTAVSSIPPPAGPGPVVRPIFVGDFETGNFSQWPNCQNVVVGTAQCSGLPPSHSMSVETSPVRQGNFAARFEVRHGESPANICCGDRAEVSGERASASYDGDERWYQWSTMFGPDFPAGQGWSTISQWHAEVDGPPPVFFAVGPTNVAAGRWGLVLSTRTGATEMGPVYVPWSAPVVPGVWNDIKMHVKWSTRDDVGFVELWHNGIPQRFTAEPCAHQTRCTVRTLIPGGGGVYFKQGYYRDPSITAPGVVFQDGFSMAATEPGLAPL